MFGDDPNNPRDPDRGPNASPTDPDRPVANSRDEQEEKLLRFIPSGLGTEILLDVWVRVKSFEPHVTSFNKRLFDAYAKEVARVDNDNSAHNDNDGILTFVEADAEGLSDGGQSNHGLFLSPTGFNRFAVTRAISAGLLAPPFTPSHRAS